MAGGGDVRVIGSSSRVKGGVANVTDNCLWVRVCNALTITPDPSACFLIDNCPATILDIDIAAQSVDVEVVQPTHDDLNANATLQLQDVDIVAGGGLGVARPQRIPVSEYGTAGLPNIYYNLLGLAELPGVGLTDPTVLRAASVNAPMKGGAGGALRTGPDRDDIVQLVNAQTFDNVTTNFQSALLSVLEARWLVIYLSIVVANAPTGILIEAEFSRDGGTNWFKWSVDQWVDLRYVPNQMPVLEAIPLNYVIGTDFRLNITAFGTTAVNTFTLSAWAEAVS